MKKHLATTLAWVVVLTVPAITNAALLEPPGFAESNNVETTVFRVIRFMLTAASALAVLGIIVGGFLYIISAGNSSRIEQARTTLTYSIVGLVVVLLAFVIASTINTILT